MGLGLAGGATFLASSLTDGGPGSVEATQPDVIDVVIARSEIGFGQIIESHMLSTQSWPAGAIPTGVFVEMSAILPGKDQEPRRALGRIYPGELLLGAKVSDFGERVTLVQKLTEGHRAMAIKVDATTAVGGFVTPGDIVDIVLTQGARDTIRAVTVLQKIRVVGVDQVSAEEHDQPSIARTTTVEVKPDQAQRLALAQKAGTLSLSLRTLDADDVEPVEQIDLRDLFAPPEVEVVEGEEPVVDVRPRVTIRRGTGASEEVIVK